jgi:hypothetical protein
MSLFTTDIKQDPISKLNLHFYTELCKHNNSTSRADSSESLSEIANIDIKRTRKRALSGQQVQADSLTKNTKTKLTVLSKGDNVIIPILSVDRGPVDERNIKGVVMNVN